MTTTEIEDRDTAQISDQDNGRPNGSDEVMRQWIELTKAGKGTTIATVRGFMDTVEKVVPDVGLSKQRQVIDAAFEMTEGLIHSQYDFVRGAMRSAVLVDVDVNVGVDVDVASRKPAT